MAVPHPLTSTVCTMGHHALLARHLRNLFIGGALSATLAALAYPSMLGMQYASGIRRA